MILSNEARVRFLGLIVLLFSIETCFAERICVLGTGYVGLVTGVGLSVLGHHVCCVDVVAEKIAQLRAGRVPIYEPGLAELMAEPVRSGLLRFETDIQTVVCSSDVIFVAVGTPMSEDGAADLSALQKAIDDIAPMIKSYKVICIKSTVPVGTCQSIIQRLVKVGVARELFDVVSNPEFLREGSAVDDFMKPDRIVIGGNPESAQRIKALYQPLFDNGTACLLTNLESSELIKYSSNAMLAMRITFINEIARLCSKTGANVHDVAKGMGLDKRIGPAFLKSGPGFGGSCFQKDTKALEYIMKSHRVGAKLTQAIFKANAAHKQKILKDLTALLGDDVKNKKVTLLGLTFKANTDDIRDSFAIDAIKYFSELGILISAYDPQGMENMRKLFPHIAYCTSAMQAIRETDLIVMVTEWNEFKKLDLNIIAHQCRTKIIADLRSLFDGCELKCRGFRYYNLGN